MAKKEVRIRRYYGIDEKQSVGLLLSELPPRVAASRLGVRQKRWRWQYHENPNNPESEPLLWVAVTGESVVGLICPLAARIKTPKGIMMASWGMDWIVSPEVRGTGVGRKLGETWLHTFPVALGRGFSRRAHQVGVALGFTTVAGFRTGWFVLSRFNFARRLYRRREMRNLQKLLTFPPKLARRRKPARAADIFASDRLPEGTSSLWAEVSATYPFAIDRHADHLRWRYEAHPTHRYEFVTLRDGKELKGVAVARLSGESPPVGVICELIVDPAEPEAVASLFVAAIEHLRSGGASAVRADVPHRLAGPVFASGYTCLETELKIIVACDDADLARMGIDEARNWYLTCGDSDADF